jgi:hypothetical protein
VSIAPLTGTIGLRRLSLDTARQACSHPTGFRAAAPGPLVPVSDRLDLTLSAFETVRIARMHEIRTLWAMAVPSVNGCLPGGSGWSFFVGRLVAVDHANRHDRSRCRTTMHMSSANSTIEDVSA